MDWDSGVACSSHWPARWYRIWYFCALLCSSGQCLPPLQVALSSNGDTSIWKMSPTVLISSVRFLLNYIIPILNFFSPSCFSPTYNIWSCHIFVNFFPPFHTVMVLTWRALRIQKTLSIFSALVPAAQNRVTSVQVQLSPWSLGWIMSVPTINLIVSHFHLPNIQICVSVQIFSSAWLQMKDYSHICVCFFKSRSVQ